MVSPSSSNSDSTSFAIAAIVVESITSPSNIIVLEPSKQQCIVDHKDFIVVTSSFAVVTYWLSSFTATYQQELNKTFANPEEMP